jgi:NAD(P) transhydrogenase subunit beta
MLNNDLLIVTGALVGSSGAILSYIMCKAMNRHFISVIAGGFGTGGGTPAAPAADGQPAGEVNPILAAETAELLRESKNVIIVPGYGMAVAQAQHKVQELYDQLTKRGVAVKFAIHPVAGRMPGHMNVLLAEANIPYSALVEMEEINPEMPQCDVALVIGANDVVNPAARYAKGSPIYGMPIIDADKAKTVLAIKRSKNPGFAGIDNELYVGDNTWMLFGDAKTVIGDLVKQFVGGGLH